MCWRFAYVSGRSGACVVAARWLQWQSLRETVFASLSWMAFFSISPDTDTHTCIKLWAAFERTDYHRSRSCPHECTRSCVGSGQNPWISISTRTAPAHTTTHATMSSVKQTGLVQDKFSTDLRQQNNLPLVRCTCCTWSESNHSCNFDLI